MCIILEILIIRLFIVMFIIKMDVKFWRYLVLSMMVYINKFFIMLVMKMIV